MPIGSRVLDSPVSFSTGAQHALAVATAARNSIRIAA
jgi:hypothetical protein